MTKPDCDSPSSGKKPKMGRKPDKSKNGVGKNFIVNLNIC